MKNWRVILVWALTVALIIGTPILAVDKVDVLKSDDVEVLKMEIMKLRAKVRSQKRRIAKLEAGGINVEGNVGGNGADVYGLTLDEFRALLAPHMQAGEIIIWLPIIGDGTSRGGLLDGASNNTGPYRPDLPARHNCGAQIPSWLDKRHGKIGHPATTYALVRVKKAKLHLYTSIAEHSEVPLWDKLMVEMDLKTTDAGALKVAFDRNSELWKTTHGRGYGKKLLIELTLRHTKPETARDISRKHRIPYTEEKR